ncbi:MAG: Fe-S cluster assembly protein SufD [Mariniphaga sp.]
MAEVIDKIGAVQRISDIYIANLRKISDGLADSVNIARQPAMKAFERMGIPGFRTENYKYTDLTKLFENENFRRAFKPDEFEVDLSEVFSCDVPEFDTHLILVVNGWYDESSNNHKSYPEGVIIKSFRKAAIENRELVEKYYGKLAKAANDPLIAMNTSFAQDGVFIYIPDNTHIDKPLQIINILRSDDDLYVNQRNMIIAGKNTQAKIMLCDHTLLPQQFINNNITEFEIGEDSVIDVYSIQNQHNKTANLTGLYIRQQQNSQLVTNAISLHGGIIRNNLSVLLDGVHASAKICGLALSDKNQHVDNFTSIEHLKPNCVSNQLYKNILDDSSIGGFTGRIHVAPHAVKTEAYQRNNNVLLSNSAKMNTKPQLVIDNDDVKCSHGATVGRIDNEALFYLQARGINEKEARLMLMFAFAHEVLAEVKVEKLRDVIDILVNKRLRGEVSKCHSCAMDCIR